MRVNIDNFNKDEAESFILGFAICLDLMIEKMKQTHSDILLDIHVAEPKKELNDMVEAYNLKYANPITLIEKVGQ